MLKNFIFLIFFRLTASISDKYRNGKKFYCTFAVLNEGAKVIKFVIPANIYNINGTQSWIC
jgi:hypothetical protein